MAEQASEASGAARSYALLIDGSTVCIRPAEATIADPVDTTAAIDAVAFRQCLEAIGADDGVDAVVSVIVPTAMGDLTEAVTAASSPRPIVAGFLRANPHGGWLPASLVRDLLDCYQIPQVSAVVARTEHDAIAAAALIGGPVVLKAEAEGIVHKTEAGAVKLDLRNLADVSAAYRDLAATFENGLTGVLVQPMLRGGIEVLTGVVQEAVFGPLVVFGLGGVATDLLGDHSARLSPLTDADARELLADDLPEVAELDLNPVIARSDGCQAAGARVRILPAEPADPFLRKLR